MEFLEPVLRENTSCPDPQALVRAGDNGKSGHGYALSGFVNPVPVQITLSDTARNTGVFDHSCVRAMVVGAPTAEQKRAGGIPGRLERL